MPVRPARLGSIDALRGLTVAAMLLVNTPGDWAHVYAPLRHAAWHGATPTDLIFPFFLFLVGVSMAFSIGPRADAPAARPALARALLVRALRIALAGVLLHLLVGWLLLEGHFRLWGVLQRIALCVAVAGLLAVYLPRRLHGAAALMLLAAYSAILLQASSLAPWVNPASRLDTRLFAPWLYQWQPATGLGHDPEGLLSSLGALATTLLGLTAGRLLRDGHSGRLLLLGGACVLVGWGGTLWLPWNKSLWTPTYALWSAGLAALLLWGSHVLVDRRGWPALGRRFGVNAIAVYLGAAVLSVLLQASGAWAAVWTLLAARLPGHLALASLLQALLFVVLWWGVAVWLDRRRLYLTI